MPTFLRITRHPADEARVSWIKAYFGSDTEIVERDIPFGDDPTSAIRNAVAEIGNVVAIELIAPMPVMAGILNARLGVPLVRAELERDSNGRVRVVGKDNTGRDILAFAEYVELLCVEISTRKLGTQ